MVGALAELLGAAAVVATLFYLSRQVREAAREAQRTRWGELRDEISMVVDQWAGNNELSDIVFRGLAGESALEPHERFRFYSNLFRLFRAWEALFQYTREGGLEAWGAESSQRTLHDILGFAGAQEYWVDRHAWYSEEFQAEVDRIISHKDLATVTAADYARDPGSAGGSDST